MFRSVNICFSEQKQPPEVFCKKGVLKNFAMESVFDKVAGLQDCNFIRKRLQHRSFPVNNAKFLRAAFF